MLFAITLLRNQYLSPPIHSIEFYFRANVTIKSNLMMNKILFYFRSFFFLLLDVKHKGHNFHQYPEYTEE